MKKELALEAQREVMRTRDALLLERAYFFLLIHHAARAYDDINTKLDDAKAAAKFFGIANLIVPEGPTVVLVPSASDKRYRPVWSMSDAIDVFKEHQLEWVPNGFNDVKDADSWIAERIHQLDFSAYAIIDDQSQVETGTIREIALEMIVSSPVGVKTSEIKERISSEYKRQIHDKTVSMTLYRMKSAGEIVRVNNLWKVAPSMPKVEHSPSKE